MRLALAKINLQVRLWAKWNVPLIAWVQPRIEEYSTDKVTVSIPLTRRQQNHLHSMYFGVLACGADVAGGLIAFRHITEKKYPIAFVFKDFTAEFLKRPEARTHFTCTDGQKLAQLVENAMATGERVQETVQVVATCPSISPDEVVAKFTLTISLKRKSKS